MIGLAASETTLVSNLSTALRARSDKQSRSLARRHRGLPATPGLVLALVVAVTLQVAPVAVAEVDADPSSINQFFIAQSDPLRLTAATVGAADARAIIQEDETGTDSSDDTPAPDTESDRALSAEPPEDRDAAPLDEAISTAPASIDNPLTPTFEGEIGANDPADFVPPYTDDLGRIQTEPLFNPPQGLLTMIFIGAFLLLAALVAGLIRHFLTKALEVDDTASGDLFQSTDERVYRFDDDDTHTAALADQTAETPAANDDDGDLSYDDNLDSDEDEKRGDDRGFMSWLFSGNQRRQGDVEDLDDDDDDTMLEDVDDDSTVIDVVAEPLSDESDDHDMDDDTDEGPYEPYDEATPIEDVHPEPTPANAPSELPDDQHATGPIEPAPRPSPRPTPLASPLASSSASPRPAETDIPPPTGNETPTGNQRPMPLRTETGSRETGPSEGTGARNYLLGTIPASVASLDQSPYQDPMLTRLQSEIATLQQKYTGTEKTLDRLEKSFANHAQRTSNEVNTLRQQAQAHQQEINKTIETRFAAISSSVEKGLSDTQAKTEQKLASIPAMNTDDLNKRIEKLDDKFNNQSRMIDASFNKVLHKIEMSIAPLSQIGKLAQETAGLKQEIGTLRENTAPVPQPQPELTDTDTKSPEEDKAQASQDTQILKTLQESLGEQQAMLRGWQDENRVVARNIEALTQRIDRLETEMYAQKKSLSELNDRTEAEFARKRVHPITPRVDPLGITSETRIPERRASEKWAPETKPQETALASEGWPRQRPTTAPSEREPGPGGNVSETWSPNQTGTRSPVPFERDMTQNGDKGNGANVALSTGYSNGRHGASHDEAQSPVASQQSPSPGVPEREDPVITPIMFSETSLAARGRAQRGEGRPDVFDPNRPDDQNDQDANGEQKTIRPLTFNFSNIDKTSTNR